MSDYWLPQAKKFDLSGNHGDGPFQRFLGVVLHVNVSERGTSDSFFANNPAQVCPNFQVYKNGDIHQYLPLDFKPWCQMNGNANYAAIETAGMPGEPLTAAQIASCGVILAAYAQRMGMLLRLANVPGQQGFGTHAMGGQAWGGHDCPGSIRTAQRSSILLAARNIVNGKPIISEDDMPLDPKDPVIVALNKKIDDAFGLVIRGDAVDGPKGDTHPANLTRILAGIQDVLAKLNPSGPAKQ